jgi:uncharacterized membrane protein YraQ (UPF0718 family)
MGAGIGPAAAFLYSGPAINVLAIILTARVLGLELGIARAVGAIGFGIVIGLIMHLIYRRQETDKLEATASTPQPPAVRPLWQNVLFFASMIAILVFANWGRPDQAEGIWSAIHGAKWILTTLFAVALAGVLVLWFRVRWWQMLLVAAPPVVLGLVLPTAPMIPFAAAVVGLSVVLSTSDDEAGEWFSESWTFTKQIMPLLLVGVLIAGALLGRPDQEGLIPSEWVSNLVGGNSLRANLFASVVGA